MSVSRRSFIKGTASGMMGAAAMGMTGASALADEAPRAPIFDSFDLFEESRVVWQDIPEKKLQRHTTMIL